MSQALYRKWRPRRWEEVVSQEHVIQTLRNAIATERVAHAYLFAGPRGTGKTTVARILAKAVNCLDPDLKARPCNRCEHCQAVNAARFLDLIEIDAASNTSVDDVRDLREKINFSPNQGRYKVYVVDEVHMLSTAAFNALLKTLEEPPAHAIFILATTEVHKIPATVLSRCQWYEFRRIPVKEIITHLEQVSAEEGIQADSEALSLVARQATGSLRDAISLLDLLSSVGERVSLEVAQAVLGTTASQAVSELIDALLAGNPSQGLERIHASMDAGSDPRQYARQVVEYLRDLLLVRMENAAQVEVTAELRALMTNQAKQFKTAQLLDLIRAFNQAANEARGSWQPALPLELAFLDGLEILTEAASVSKRGTIGRDRPGTSKSGAPRIKPATYTALPQGEGVARAPKEAATEESEAEDSQSLHSLTQNWRQILTLVREQNPNTYGLLNSSKTRHLKGNILTLGFASDVLKNQMSKQDNLEIVQRALAKVLEADIRIRCVISTATRNSIPPEVDNNGMVATALRDLGGEIVDVQ